MNPNLIPRLRRGRKQKTGNRKQETGNTIKGGEGSGSKTAEVKGVRALAARLPRYWRSKHAELGPRTPSLQGFRETIAWTCGEQQSTKNTEHRMGV